MELFVPTVSKFARMCDHAVPLGLQAKTTLTI